MTASAMNQELDGQKLQLDDPQGFAEALGCFAAIVYGIIFFIHAKIFEFLVHRGHIVDERCLQDHLRYAMFVLVIECQRLCENTNEVVS